MVNLLRIGYNIPMQTLLDSESLANEVQALPPMVPSLLRLTELIGEGDYSLLDVEKLIHFDQGLTLDTLKLANSAAMASQVRIGSVREAVIRLGAERLSQYLFSRWLGGAVRIPLRAYGVDASRFWSHGVITGLTCERLAQQNGNADAGLSYTAGLLHDFGKLVLDHFAQRMRIEVDWSSLPDTDELMEAERLVFGTDHRAIGASLMNSWNFPETIIRASVEIRGTSWDSSMLGLAHRVDCWIVGQEQGSEKCPLADPSEKELAQAVWQDYQTVRNAVGV